ncbi:dephospho-CoA kinase [Streptococcus porci]|uniref:dephospho-CoA kinase n=1 Tax=Streptococcus porci TaxID=502567 RepID=UPI0004044B90|nr:dephospho-CoA kinase [Streptococcus porci]
MTKIIGITGGIASGKSTVSSYLRELGQIVIDADEVVHDLQKKGGALYQALVGWLGTEILQADGELDRKKLAALLFGSNEKLAKSANLQNPIIRKELAKRRDRALQDNELVFLDLPLLYELGYEDWCNQVWLIYVDRETQIQRLMARNQLTKEEAQLRISRQMPLEEKRALADLVLENTGDLETLKSQIKQLVIEMEQD